MLRRCSLSGVQVRDGAADESINGSHVSNILSQEAARTIGMALLEPSCCHDREIGLATCTTFSAGEKGGVGGV